MGKNALIPSDVIRNVRFPQRMPTVAADVGGLLRDGALRAAVHGEDPRLLARSRRASGCCRCSALFAMTSFFAGPLYDRSAPRSTITAGAVGLAVGPFLLSMVDAARLRALIAGLARDRNRRRPLLPVGHDRGGHRARPLALEPRGRADLHVPDRRRRDRPRPSRRRSSRSSPRTSSTDKATAAGTSLTDHQIAVLHGSLAGTDSGQRAFNQLQRRSAQNASLDVVRDSFASGIQAGFRFVSRSRSSGVPDLAVLRRRSPVASRSAASSRRLAA